MIFAVSRTHLIVELKLNSCIFFEFSIICFLYYCPVQGFKNPYLIDV